MILTVLLILLVGATLLALSGKKRTALTACVLALGTTAFVGCGFIPNQLLTRLQDSYSTHMGEWQDDNAIIILGVGIEIDEKGIAEPSVFGYGRILKTIELYNDCKHHSSTCKVIVSGGTTAPHHAAEADIYAAEMKFAGITAQDIVEEARSLNTFQNAQFTSKVLSGAHFKKIVLVTSGIHMTRSLLYFKHFGVVPEPVRADFGRATFSVLPTSYNFLLTDLALHEYVGILRYHIYNLLNLNPPRVSVAM